MGPIRIFLSYAHEDAAKWLDRVRVHIDSLKHVAHIEVFDDNKIIVGMEWDKLIKEKLDSAHIIILILTPAFIRSDYCHTIELEMAIKRHGQGAATVVPIIADFCAWDFLPLTELQLMPKDSKQNLKPLSKWKNCNEPLDIIRQHILSIIRDYRPTSPTVMTHELIPTSRQIDTTIRDIVDYEKLLNFTYLIDREPQTADLITALEEAWATGPPLPIFGIAAGAVEHRHDLLVELFAKEELEVDCTQQPILLGAFARLEIPSFDFPFGEVEFPERHCRDFIRGVAGKVGASHYTAAAVCDAINHNIKMPCAFSSNIYTEHYKYGGKKLLELWLDFWNEVGAEVLQYPVCVLLCIREPTIRSGQPQRLGRRGVDKIEVIRQEVYNIARQRHHIRTQNFRKFTPITRRMVFDWLGNRKLIVSLPKLVDHRLAVEEQIASKLGMQDAFPLDHLCRTIHQLRE